jgi:hypothetical protein
MTNYEKFCEEYEKQLMIAVQTYPSDYFYGPEKVPETARKMAIAFKNNTYNYDSKGIKFTCKSLGIKHTRKAINEYIKG